MATKIVAIRPYVLLISLLFLAATAFMSAGPNEDKLIIPVAQPGRSPAPGAKPELTLDDLSCIGQGRSALLPLKPYSAQRVERFETGFEEFAPGRNSGANEWSAFGVEGDRDFNAIGRDMRVRYPLFDLVFRIQDGKQELAPGDMGSFVLGLVHDRLPAVWGGWRHGDLVYKISAMTVPDEKNGYYDLYKLEVQNPTTRPATSLLVAGFDGPPDLRLEDGVVRGLGAVPLTLADKSVPAKLTRREWGLCDKRAKAYETGFGPAKGKEVVGTFRLGLDGVPVVYRVRVDPAKKYTVCLVSAAHVSGALLEVPQKSGDQVFFYKVEGARSQTLDYVEYIRRKDQPLFAGFDGARDVDGDGYIEIAAGVTDASPVRYTWLSRIYIFPEGTKVGDPAAVYSGSLDKQCLRHIEVGATPEQGSSNQDYDKTDVGLARLDLRYDDVIRPHEVRTWWLKVPPIHRREPVSMGFMAHAFRDVRPGEAPPPFPEDRVASLKAADPKAAENLLLEYWGRFFARAARLDLPDPILNDIFLSRLATRALLDVKIMDGVVYNACSPFFYFDHAYRDQSYVIFALDLAGLHDRAERLLHAYCMDVKDVTRRGPISFDGQPLQLGMLPNGLWNTRPGQYDTQGQNIWALVQHYKLSGDRIWLDKTAYPFIRRGAEWLVQSRHKHMREVKDPRDPRYGLIEPGAMEVWSVGQGMHMYYMNAFGVLGLREAADAAAALGNRADAEHFAEECRDLRESLLRSFRTTFKRTGLYEGYLWFGVEPKGVGMYGFWAHNCLLWPCRALDPQDPMLTATWRRMDLMAQQWGGGMFSERQGNFWPYIGVDRAISHILRGDPDRALDYFCAFVDTAGGTLSWGEGYDNMIATGDQPHFWADAQYVNLLRHLFVMEDGPNLLLTPALPRRWHRGTKSVQVHGLATHFGDLDLTIQPQADGNRLDYQIQLTPRGDQDRRDLAKFLLHPRTPEGRAIRQVIVDGRQVDGFSDGLVVIPRPLRNKPVHVEILMAN